MHPRYHMLTRVAIAATLVAALHPRVAQAIPVFANGQGVSCSLCHSAPPNLNAYGRYILATNFTKGLDAHRQMEENSRDPVSFEITGNGSNTPTPGLPSVSVDLAQLLAAGYLGKNVTYYASVPIVEGGFPAAAVDQVWAAYNGFSSGNGSLQIGKFPAPMFAPWLSQSLSLSGYSLAAMPVGLNTVGVGDNRWGGSYTQMGSRGLVGTVAYLTNTGAAESAFDGDVDSGGEGQSYVGSLLFMNPNSHFTGGIAAMTGTFPLPSGTNDRFGREMALVSYSTSPKYSLNAMALVGYDNNPNDGASLAAGSNGMSYEAIYNPYAWLHVDTRYERTNDGLGAIQNNYIGDLAFSVMPNLVLTLENASSVGARPATSYQLLWAGPWIRTPSHQAPASVAAAPGAPGAAAVAASGTTAPASPEADIQAGSAIFAANCSMCHGANGEGGVGPNLHKIAQRRTLAGTIAFIENPSGGMPKLFPSTLSADQVREVATYIRTTFL